MLDIILLGATGFTGKYALKTLHKLTQNTKITWGIAGRNRDKLVAILNQIKAENVEINVKNIPIIVVDLNDLTSIIAMTSRTRLVLNCCGPFRFLGENVVKACIETGTHHVDVSGEPYYMEKMQLLYDKRAGEKGIYIVSSCGMDSIPCEMGAIFMQRNFDGTLNSIETFLKHLDVGDSPGPSINYGTWESAVYEIANIKQLKEIRSKLFPSRLPIMKPELPRRILPFKNGNVNKSWNVLLPHSNRSVMLRTQRYFFEKENRRPIQIRTYLNVENFFNVIILAIVGLFFTSFARFKLGQKLLLNHPGVFTLGFIDKNPSIKKVEEAAFTLTLYGRGWKRGDNYEKYPNKGIIVEVRGVNPVYGVTCTSAVLSALTILNEKPKLPAKGGVYSPGVLFEKTTLIEQLNRNGIELKLVKIIDI